MQWIQKEIGFIGGGNMATYLLKGFSASGHPSKQLWVSDPWEGGRGGGREGGIPLLV
jgi:pyrroline-5-carboxylate reductase